ncbi:UNVERIFIED_CONTAM: hypothetical protein K2H54_004336 [Gekko kuhli]
MRIPGTARQFAMAYPTRGVLWLPEETECLLRTLLDMDTGPRVMPSTHLETQGLFTDVSAAMCAAGFRCTSAQVRAKFKREKSAFFDTLEDWQGIPPEGIDLHGSTSSGTYGSREADPDGDCGHPTVRQGRGGCCQLQRRPWRRLDLRRTLAMSQEPMDSNVLSLLFHVEPVVVVSSPDTSPGQATDAETVPHSGQEEDTTTLVSSALDSDAVNRHTYRLGFVQRGMVRLRQMVQRSSRGHQRHAGQRRQDPLGYGDWMSQVPVVTMSCSGDLIGGPIGLPPMGPGFVAMDAVPGGPLQARLGCAAWVAVAQLYAALGQDCGGCVGGAHRPLNVSDIVNTLHGHLQSIKDHFAWH